MLGGYFPAGHRALYVNVMLLPGKGIVWSEVSEPRSIYHFSISTTMNKEKNLTAALQLRYTSPDFRLQKTSAK